MLRPAELAAQTIRERRTLLEKIGRALSEEAVESGSMGLAFSGGGIRSATISLGVAQALAHKGRLLDFDYCSTVSGGGYFGSFLGSLFLPNEARGPEPQTINDDELKRQADFAVRVLTDKSADTETTILMDDGSSISARHPVRWLREHSRYLAPDGASDYLAGATYVVRNWLAMIYVFALPVALFSTLAIALSLALVAPPAGGDFNPLKEAVHTKVDFAQIAGVLRTPVTAKPPLPTPSKEPAKSASQNDAAGSAKSGGGLRDALYLKPKSPEPCKCEDRKTDPIVGTLLSPLWFVVGVLAYITLSLWLAFWFTEYLSDQGSRLKYLLQNEASRLDSPWLGRLASILFSTKARLFYATAGILGLGAAGLLYWTALHQVVTLATLDHPLDHLVEGTGILILLSCLNCAIATAWILRKGQKSRDKSITKGNAFTAEIRRVLTRSSAMSVGGTLILAALAAIDSLGLTAYAKIVALAERTEGGDFLTALIAAVPLSLAPFGAWVINKLPHWFGGSDGKAAQLLGRNVWTVALFAAITLYGLLAVAVHVGLQYLFFEGKQWAVPGYDINDIKTVVGLPFWTTISFVFLAIALVTRFTGASTGFINLSSLHGLYATRLTRAYIGASNIARLESAANSQVHTISIKESDPGDQIPIRTYQTIRTAAPIHLVNVTLNETISQERSQLLERDRKGVPLVFAPEGILIEAKRKETADSYFSWDAVREHAVESLSVGQLCAISGAAASTGMGSKTTLGGALALSFGNIRLGVDFC